MKMKNFTLSYVLPAVLSAFLSVNALAQCVPLGPEECPDPENNGEICPDSLAIGFLNQPYSQVATILAPLQDTSGVTLHHLTLVSVDDMPPGMAWVSNAPNNEFMAGNYYCILMDGTPTDTGTFYLKIVVDIYIDFMGFPVLAGSVTDSTSLAIVIVDNTGFKENSGKNLVISCNYPNPFTTWTSIRYLIKETGPVRLELYSLLGERLHEQEMLAAPGENYFHYNGENLKTGIYYYVLRSRSYFASGMMIRGN